MWPAGWPRLLLIFSGRFAADAKFGEQERSSTACCSSSHDAKQRKDPLYDL